MIAVLLVQACSQGQRSSGPVAIKLPEKLRQLDGQLAALDHLSPNLRGSQLYRSLEKDYSLAEMKKVAERGNSMAMLLLGFYHKHQQPDGLLDPAAVAFQMACDMGNSLGCVNLGTLYDWPGQPFAEPHWRNPNHQKAFELYQLACEQNNAIGCRLWGRQFSRSNLGPADMARAKALYQRSCDLGNAFGCYDLGTLYYKGRFVEKDLIKAKSLFDFSCGVAQHQAACLQSKRLSYSLARKETQ